MELTVAKTFSSRAWNLDRPGLRTAHLRDPEGVLIELQSY